MYPKDKPLEEFIDYFNSQPISNYITVERDDTVKAFYKLRFTKN